MTEKSWRLIVIRICLPVLITILLFIGTSYLLTIPYLERSLLESKRDMIQELTDNVWSVIQQHHNKVLSGELSLKDAQDRVIEIIRSMRYGPEQKDYFWINDMHPNMIMHPYRTDLEGKDITTFADPNGTFLFVEFVKIVKKESAGYVDYMWQWKDDETRIVPKTSYVRGFEPWGWIVGTGIYIEDIQEKIRNATKSLNTILAVILCIILTLSAIIIFQALQSEKNRSIAEDALLESEQFLKDIIEFLPDATFVVDEQKRVIAWNRAMQEISGISSQEIIGKGDYEYAIPFYGEKRPLLGNVLLSNLSEYEEKYTILDKDDKQITAETFTPKLGEKGKIYTGKSQLII
jgi:PAS domain S-box-containing protein